MKQIVIIELFVAHLVLIYFNLNPVLTANLNVTNEKYIGRNATTPHTPCILSAFAATITVKPEDSNFTGTTYANLSPETSIVRTTKCMPSLIQHYYRFNDSFDEKSRHQSLLSVGFEIGIGNSVEMHIRFIEAVCDRPDGCLRSNYRYCSERRGSIHSNCLRMSATLPIVWLRDGQTYQCSHNSKSYVKDVAYFGEIPLFRGYFEVDLHYVRIDATNSTETFNPIRYCLMDWLLDTTLLIIVSSIVCLILLSIICKCLYDCRRDAKRSKFRPNRPQESLEWNKCQNESETEKLKPTVQL